MNSSIYWHLLGTGDKLQDEYWNLKWAILCKYWDDETLKEMYREFKRTKWSKMNWEIYSKYHKEEIQQRQRENYENNKQEIMEKRKQYRETHKVEIKERRQIYLEEHRIDINRRNREHVNNVTVKCECGGSYADIPSKKNKHLNIIKHMQYAQSTKSLS